MTITHPNNTRIILTRILVLLAFTLLVSAIWLVIAYNRLVNLKHGVSDLNTRLKQVQTENAGLKNSLFTLVSQDGLDKFVQSRNLILEKNPKYLSVNSQWSLALQ